MKFVFGVLIVLAAAAFGGCIYLGMQAEPTPAPSSTPSASPIPLPTINVEELDAQLEERAQSDAEKLARGEDATPPTIDGCFIQGIFGGFDSRAAATQAQATVAHQQSSATAIGHGLAKDESGGFMATTLIATCEEVIEGE